jgi:hypothetical protein
MLAALDKEAQAGNPLTPGYAKANLQFLYDLDPVSDSRRARLSFEKSALM